MTMTTQSQITSVFFRKKPCRRHSVTSPLVLTTPHEEEMAQGEYLVCKRCLNLVVLGSDRIEINGAHSHSFTNPHGLFFDIGCFTDAPGCVYSGKPSLEFTWFAGFAWQIALCSRCTEHLGWLFTSGERLFTGLILDKIVPAPSGPVSGKYDV